MDPDEIISVMVYQSDGIKRFMRGPAGLVAANLSAVDAGTSATVDAFVTAGTTQQLAETGTVEATYIPPTATDYETLWPDSRFYFNLA